MSLNLTSISGMSEIIPSKPEQGRNECKRTCNLSTYLDKKYLYASINNHSYYIKITSERKMN